MSFLFQKNKKCEMTIEEILKNYLPTDLVNSVMDYAVEHKIVVCSLGCAGEISWNGKDINDHPFVISSEDVHKIDKNNPLGVIGNENKEKLIPRYLAFKKLKINRCYMKVDRILLASTLIFPPNTRQDAILSFYSKERKNRVFKYCPNELKEWTLVVVPFDVQVESDNVVSFYKSTSYLYEKSIYNIIINNVRYGDREHEKIDIQTEMFIYDENGDKINPLYYGKESLERHPHQFCDEYFINGTMTFEEAKREYLAWREMKANDGNLGTEYDYSIQNSYRTMVTFKEKEEKRIEMMKEKIGVDVCHDTIEYDINRYGYCAILLCNIYPHYFRYEDLYDVDRKLVDRLKERYKVIMRTLMTDGEPYFSNDNDYINRDLFFYDSTRFRVFIRNFNYGYVAEIYRYVETLKVLYRRKIPYLILHR